MSDIILHEVMKGLCEFAETKMYKQYPDDILKSLEYLKNTSKDMKYEYQELYAIYKWYKIDRPQRTVKNDIGTSLMYYDQDSKMLSRAVNIRKFSKNCKEEIMNFFNLRHKNYLEGDELEEQRMFMEIANKPKLLGLKKEKLKSKNKKTGKNNVRI